MNNDVTACWFIIFFHLKDFQNYLQIPSGNIAAHVWTTLCGFIAFMWIIFLFLSCIYIFFYILFIHLFFIVAGSSCVVWVKDHSWFVNSCHTYLWHTAATVCSNHRRCCFIHSMSIYTQYKYTVFIQHILLYKTTVCVVLYTDIFN